MANGNKPPRRLLGWRWKGKHETLAGLPARDIPLSEAEEKPRWLSILSEPHTKKYYKPVYTNPEKGQH